MAQGQSAGDSPDPDETGGVPDNPAFWGNNGLVGEGRYRLTRRLGRGGMAEVFAAEDVRLGRTVAVKLLRSDLAEDPVSKARFTREAQSVAGLNHPAVVAVYDSGEDVVPGGTVPYIVMELVEGRTVRDLLRDGRTPRPDKALEVVTGVLDALAYSHQRGIVHRDIKPANVIITNDGAVKVMDFGIARALDGAQATMTQTGMVMGTPQYLSPEQAMGKAIDTRSDLYAVGCLLYELLTGRPPFVGETPLSVVYQHVQDEPRLPSKVSEEVPPELDGLVMRSLAKEPEERFQSAEEMRALVSYGLRMLGEQGGHTGGLWNTGAVSATGTPPQGGPTVSRGVGDTPPMGPPMVTGRPGDDGDDLDGDAPRRRGGVGVALVALVVAALLAGGAFLFLRNSGNADDSDKGPGTSPTAPVQRETDDVEPTEEDEEPPPTEEEDGQDWTTPTETPSATPSDEPTEESPPPSSPAPTDDTGTDPGEDSGGSTDPGEDVGGTDEGTSTGTDQGTSVGADEGTSAGEDDGGQTTGDTSAGGPNGGQSGGQDGARQGG